MGTCRRAATEPGRFHGLPLEECLAHHSLPPGFPTLALGVEKYWRRRHNSRPALPPPPRSHRRLSSPPRTQPYTTPASLPSHAPPRSRHRQTLSLGSRPTNVRHLVPRLCEAPQAPALARLCGGTLRVLLALPDRRSHEPAAHRALIRLVQRHAQEPLARAARRQHRQPLPRLLLEQLRLLRRARARLRCVRRPRALACQGAG